MRPRLLVVSPHFCPVNTPDMQRVRMSLPRWIERGWSVTVLTVDDPTPQAPLDPELASTLPPGVEVVRARCLPRWLTRWLGIGNVALRALPFLFVAGSSLLTRRPYAAVYFSTTMFVVMPFGRLWRWFHGVPYALDLQDPWVTDFYARRGLRPPGGAKYAAVSRVSACLERWSLRQASHVFSVSPAYLEDIARRYPWFDRTRGSVLPFGAPLRDFAVAAPIAPRAALPNFAPRLLYVGRLGPALEPALRVLLHGLARVRKAGSRATLECVGTAYVPAAGADKSTATLVDELGLHGAVREEPGRVAYLDSLRLMRAADANIVLGSGDPGYTPSKILACLAAHRPLLALAPRGSAMEERLRELQAPLISFSSDEVDLRAIDAVGAFIRDLRPDSPAPFAVPAGYTDDAVADTQLAVFARLASTA